MGFVAYWKAFSIILTGAFGILGLLQDFKDKQTGKVTRWGYISLFGIVLSTILGFAAQMKESRDAATQSLRLAEHTNETLNQLQRILTPIESFRVVTRFSLDCKNEEILKICSVVQSYKPEVDGDSWDAWPGGAKGTVFGLEFEFYKAKFDKTELLVDGIPKDANSDFQFDMDSSSAAQGNIHIYNDKESGPTIAIVGTISGLHQTNTVRGFSDLTDATVVVKGYGRFMRDLQLRELLISPKQGYEMRIKGNFKQIDYMSTEDRAVFEGKFIPIKQ